MNNNMTQTITCDICHYMNTVEAMDWGFMRLGVPPINGTPLKDICPACTIWLYNVAEERRKEQTEMNKEKEGKVMD